MGWMISDDSGSNPALYFTLFFQKFSKYFCRINSVGKGRPAAGSIATAFSILVATSELTSSRFSMSNYNAISVE